MRIATAILACAMCSSATSAAAQTPSPQFGVKLGPTFSNVNIDPADPDADTGTRWGIGGGGFVVLPLTPRISLQFEGLFTPKGSTVEAAEGSDFEGAEVHLALDYLEFPVLLRIDGGRSAERSFHAFAGPSLAYNTSARTEVVVDGEFFDNGVSDNIRDDIKLFDFSLVVGAGLDIGRYFVIDARYSWGLTNVNDASDDDTVIKNRAFTILAGVRLGRRNP